MKNNLETRLGFFFALVLLASAVIMEMLGGLDIFRGGTAIKARFSTIGELKKGAPVKMAGVQVGRVTETVFDQDKVLVLMKITDSKATIRTDSKATIRFTGLMGENYIALDFGTPKGRPITTDAELTTYEQPDLSALVSKLEGVAGGIKKMTDNFSDANLNELLVPFTDFLKESKPRIMGILTNTETISQRIVSGGGTVGKLINDDTLHAAALATVTNLNTTATDINAAINEARAIVQDIADGKGTIGKLAKDEAVYAQLAEAVTNLKEILQKINQGQGSVGKLVNDESLFKNAKMTLQKLDKATEGLEDQGPLTVIGIMANNLF